LIVPPSLKHGKHDNQTYGGGFWAGMAGGWCGGFAFRRGESKYFGRSGGWATGAISAPCGQFRLFLLIPPPKDITINWRPRWRGRKRLGDGVAAPLLGGGNRCILGILGTVNRRPRWRGRKRPGDCVAACFDVFIK
jgi:hypothetical protein